MENFKLELYKNEDRLMEITFKAKIKSPARFSLDDDNITCKMHCNDNLINFKTLIALINFLIDTLEEEI